MIIPMYYLRESNIKLQALKRTIMKNTYDAKIVSNKFRGILFDMSNAFKEMIFNIEIEKDKLNNNSNIYIHTIYNMGLVHMDIINKLLKNISSDSTQDDFLNAIDSIIFPKNFQYETYDSSLYDYYFIKYLENGRFISFSNFFSNLAKSIKTNNRLVNILEINCNVGQNIIDFKKNFSNNNNKFYGIKKDSASLKDTKIHYDKVIIGPIKGSNITNNVFDILLLNTSITINSYYSNMTILTKEEKTTITKSLNYLRPGGIAAIRIPFFRLYKDISYLLAKNLSNIQVICSDTVSYNKTGIIYVVGIKKEDKEINPKDYMKMRKAFECNFDTEISERTLPTSSTDVQFFRGYRLDEEDIKLMYESSPSINQFWNSQNRDIDTTINTKSPLLPFNIGQLGLVLTSGCLDGLVDERNGCCHVIKGRVVKKKDTAENIDLDKKQIEITETSSNRVEINIFLSDGTYKILA